MAITPREPGCDPSADDWLSDSCALRGAGSIRQGAYLAGDGFIIDIMQGAFPAELLGAPPTPEEVAENLAAVLGGQASAYACP